MVELLDIAPGDIYDAQQTALINLQLMATGQTHKIISEFSASLEARVMAVTDGGNLDTLDMVGLFNWLDEQWPLMFSAWLDMFQEARIEGAAIAYGSMAYHHNQFFGLIETNEARRGYTEQTPFPKVGLVNSVFFEDSIAAIINATARHVYEDGLTLSSRIWRLDAQSLEGIKGIVAAAATSGQSAWKTAQQLEGHLGANQECTRWTSTRLGLTKKQIAKGDKRGLVLADTPCSSAGVAYNALRMARNEINIIHQRALDDIFSMSPWVTAERIFLSPSHPIRDICDDVVEGGDNGDGVYPVGTISLPIHVQCLCNKAAELMPPGRFIDRMRAQIRTPGAWPEMSNYQASIGASASELANPSLLVPFAAAMLAWLNNSNAELEANLTEALGASTRGQIHEQHA